MSAFSSNGIADPRSSGNDIASPPQLCGVATGAAVSASLLHLEILEITYWIINLHNINSNIHTSADIMPTALAVPSCLCPQCGLIRFIYLHYSARSVYSSLIKMMTSELDSSLHWLRLLS